MSCQQSKQCQPQLDNRVEATTSLKEGSCILIVGRQPLSLLTVKEEQ
jgi:hypothetical protein